MIIILIQNFSALGNKFANLKCFLNVGAVISVLCLWLSFVYILTHMGCIRSLLTQP